MKRLFEVMVFLWVVFLFDFSFGIGSPVKAGVVKAKGETVEQIGARVAAEAEAAYRKCRYSSLSKDYFSRFSREDKAKCSAGEVLIDSGWKIVFSDEGSALTRRMAKHLEEFLRERMGVRVGTTNFAGR